MPFRNEAIESSGFPSKSDALYCLSRAEGTHQVFEISGLALSRSAVALAAEGATGGERCFFSTDRLPEKCLTAVGNNKQQIFIATEPATAL